jgi:hypothetical protein
MFIEFEVRPKMIENIIRKKRQNLKQIFIGL